MPRLVSLEANLHLRSEGQGIRHLDLERRRALTAQIDAYVRPYLARNPRAKRAVDALLRPGTSETEIPGMPQKKKETKGTLFHSSFVHFFLQE